MYAKFKAYHLKPIADSYWIVESVAWCIKAVIIGLGQNPMSNDSLGNIYGCHIKLEKRQNHYTNKIKFSASSICNKMTIVQRS